MDARMTPVAVGDEFEEKRTVLVVDGPLAGELNGALSGDDVHTVYLSAGLVSFIIPKRQRSECERPLRDGENGIAQQDVTLLRVERDNEDTDLQTRDFISTSEVLGVGGTASSGSTHAVLVVLANEDRREVP